MIPRKLTPRQGWRLCYADFLLVATSECSATLSRIAQVACGFAREGSGEGERHRGPHDEDGDQRQAPLQGGQGAGVADFMESLSTASRCSLPRRQDPQARGPARKIPPAWPFVRRFLPSIAEQALDTHNPM